MHSLQPVSGARALILCALLAAASPMRADDSPQVAPEACAGLSNNAERLACYDSIFGTRPVTAQPGRTLGEMLGITPPAVDDQGEDDSPEPTAIPSLLDSRWELSRPAKLGTFVLREHRPVYMLPAFWASRRNALPGSPNPDNVVSDPQSLRSVENKYQISFKTKVAQSLFGDNGDLWFAYTQNSRWQIFDSSTSRPFRETNYEPEAFLTFRSGFRFFGWDARMVALGVNHQSNGRSLPLSRSWNRVFGIVAMERGDTVLSFRPWVRLNEDAEDDDNPDIEDFIGRADMLLAHTRNGHTYSLLMRHTLRGGDQSRGAVQFDWSFPLSRALRGHVQAFNGYGESLIDYNHHATYIGVGVSLVDWF